MEAFILAAGKSARLGELTANIPKGLIDVGGMTLLDRSLVALADVGLRRVTIVVGCHGDVIRRHFSQRSTSVAVDFIENADWNDTGSVQSLRLAASRQTSAWALILESDLLYSSGFLETALRRRCNTLLTADPSGSGDEVWVLVNDLQNLTMLGKRVPSGMTTRAIGEFAGISLLSRQFLEDFQHRAAALFSGGNATGHYEELILAMAQDGFPVAVSHCAGLPWTEVDNVADLERARRDVLPRLVLEK